jgi:hypothetical protein
MDNERLEDTKAETMFPGIDYSARADDPAAMSGNVAIARKLHQEIMESVQAIADGEPDGEMQAKFASVYVEDEKPIEVPRDADVDQPAEDEWWRDVAVHFGKNEGKLIGEMDKNRLYGWWANWEPKPYKGKISEADQNFRKALDEAGAHYQFKA